MKKLNYKKMYYEEKDSKEYYRDIYEDIQKRYTLTWIFILIVLLIVTLVTIGHDVYSSPHPSNYHIYKNECHNETDYSQFNNLPALSEKCFNITDYPGHILGVNCYQQHYYIDDNINLPQMEVCNKTEVNISQKHTRIDFLCETIKDKIPKEICNVAIDDVSYSYPQVESSFKIDKSWLDKNCQCIKYDCDNRNKILFNNALNHNTYDMESYNSKKFIEKCKNSCSKYKCGDYEVDYE